MRSIRGNERDARGEAGEGARSPGSSRGGEQRTKSGLSPIAGAVHISRQTEQPPANFSLSPHALELHILIVPAFRNRRLTRSPPPMRTKITAANSKNQPQYCVGCATTRTR
jgi:hypothetical protein